jgi:hypothetical protein
MRLRLSALSALSRNPPAAVVRGESHTTGQISALRREQRERQRGDRDPPDGVPPQPVAPGAGAERQADSRDPRYHDRTEDGRQMDGDTVDASGPFGYRRSSNARSVMLNRMLPNKLAAAMSMAPSRTFVTTRRRPAATWTRPRTGCRRSSRTAPPARQSAPRCRAGDIGPRLDRGLQVTRYAGNHPHSVPG